jgi:hypothetical protein
MNVDLRLWHNVARSQLVEAIVRAGDEKRLGPVGIRLANGEGPETRANQYAR